METKHQRITDGRPFDPTLSAGGDYTLIVNEAMVSALGWSEPVGETVRFQDRAYTVIGVVEDFHHRSFYGEIRPTMLRLTAEAEFDYLIVRTRPGSGFTVAEALEQTWRSLFPNIPYDGFFQDDVFARAFRDNQTVTGLMGTTGIIALLLSCMGLFGLVVLLIARKRRDLSIHKVLGATVWQVAQLINRPFTRLLVVAALIATPLAYFLLNLMLDSLYVYHVSVGPAPFLLGGFVIVGTAVLTIASQVYRAAMANPAESLRTE
jgi:putative ABC transport system permease protein